MWQPVRKVTPSSPHQRQTALEPALLELELRNAVAEQAADAIGALEHGHRRGRRGSTGRPPRAPPVPRSTTATRLSVARRRGGCAAIHPSANARSMIAASADLMVTGGVVDAEHARSLARRGAQASGEFGKVVRRVQPIDRRAPPIAIHEIVPVGNQVAERAALMTERNAAVHAARRLILQRRVARTAAGLHASRAAARAIGRVGGFCRWISRKPVALPMRDLQIRCQHGVRRPSSSRARACSRAASPS